MRDAERSSSARSDEAFRSYHRKRATEKYYTVPCNFVSVMHHDWSRRMSWPAIVKSEPPSTDSKPHHNRGVPSAAPTKRGTTMKQNVSTLRRPSDSNAATQPDRQASRPDHLPLKLLRFDDVQERTGLSRSTIWRLEHRGVFPKRIQVSVNVVAWLEDEVVAWIQARIERVAV